MRLYDKSWVNLVRTDPAYVAGVSAFVEVATNRAPVKGLIICPCVDCGLTRHKSCEMVKEHLIFRGLEPIYKRNEDWEVHGEANDSKHISTS